MPSNANLQSPACKKLGINDTAGLKGMFLKHVSQIAHKHSLQLQGWGDIFFVSETEPLAPSTLETKEIYSHAWMSLHYALQRAHQLANAGYKVSDVVWHSCQGVMLMHLFNRVCTRPGNP